MQFIGPDKQYGMYCVHLPDRTFIGTISKYLGRWSFHNRTPFGYSEPYDPSPSEMRQIADFMEKLD